MTSRRLDEEQTFFIFSIKSSSSWTRRWQRRRKGVGLSTTCWNNRCDCALSACRKNNNCKPSQVDDFPSLVLPRIREAAKTHKLVEQELAHAVNATALVLTEAKLSSPEVRHRGGGGRWTHIWLVWSAKSETYRFSAIRPSPVAVYRLLVLQLVNMKSNSDVKLKGHLWCSVTNIWK